MKEYIGFDMRIAETAPYDGHAHLSMNLSSGIYAPLELTALCGKRLDWCDRTTCTRERWERIAAKCPECDKAIHNTPAREGAA